MKRLFLGMAVLVLMYSTQASAGLIGSITHNYGIGQYNPGGNDALSADHVTVSDQTNGRFYDVFDFSSFGGTITSLDLRLDFSGAGPNVCFIIGECWFARLQGSNSNSWLLGEEVDDLFVMLEDGSSPQTITVSAASDGLLVDVFAHSVAQGSLGLWFSEMTMGADAFQLNSATLTAMGEPTSVPEPSMLWLMSLGLGVAVWKSRRRRLTVAA